MTAESTQLLLYGGTFDPPHRAHVELPRLVAQRLGCDQILYIPARSSPLKERDPTPAAHRLVMLRLALSRVPEARISTIELDRPGPSYTVDTLERLRDAFGPSVPMRLLIGTDQAVQFHRWRQWERILEFATPAVMLRPPSDRESLREAMREVHGDAGADRWLDWTVDVPVMGISASRLRQQIAAGEDPGSDLAAPVLAYIRDHGLYAAQVTSAADG